MKPRFGNILLFFLITLILLSFYFSSNQKKISKASYIAAQSTDKIFVGLSYLTGSDKPSFKIYWGADDAWEASDLEFGKFNSLDVKKNKILVMTDTSCLNFELKKDDKGDYIERSSLFNLTDLYSMIPYQQKSLFPAPKIESCIFSPNDATETVLCLSQCTSQEVRLIFVQRNSDGLFKPLSLPVLRLLVKEPAILNLKFLYLKDECYLVSMLVKSGNQSKLVMAMNVDKAWIFLENTEIPEIFEFAGTKLENQNIEFLMQAKDNYLFMSLQPEKSTIDDSFNFNSIFSKNLKLRPASISIDTNEIFAVAGLKGDFLVFSASENSLYQNKLINWEKGVFSESKQVSVILKSDSITDLSQFWVLIIFVLAIVMMVIIFAILKSKNVFRNISDPVAFLEETKILQSKKKNNVKTKPSEHKPDWTGAEEKKEKNKLTDSEKIKLITKTGVERPEKDKYPDFTDPFSIFEHWGYIPAGLLVRTLAAGIDLLILAPIFFGVGNIMNIRIDDLFSGPDWFLGHIIIIIVHLIYFVFMEYYFGKSLGKMFVGITVKTVNNETPGFINVLLRNLVRIPDYYLFIAIFFSIRAQRLGDRIAGTVVIYDTKISEDF